jgi:hypothetical protein
MSGQGLHTLSPQPRPQIVQRNRLQEARPPGKTGKRGLFPLEQVGKNGLC